MSISGIKPLRKSTEQFGHRQIRFPVAEIHGGIEQNGFTRTRIGIISTPQIAVQQGWRRLITGKKLLNALQQTFTKLLQPATITVFQRQIQLKTESMRAPE